MDKSDSPPGPRTRLSAWLLALPVAWTLLVAASLWSSLAQIQRTVSDMALNAARAGIEKDLLYRQWAAAHGAAWAIGLAMLLAGAWHIRQRQRDGDAARKRLQQSEEMLRESQAIAGLGTYVIDDLAVGTWRSSTILDSIFGIDATYGRSVEGWGNLVHPDDRAMMMEYFQNEVLARGAAFDKEYRIVRPSDQAVRWVHGLGRLEFDKQGRPRTMQGTITDITARKQAQEALRRSQEKFAKTFQLNPDAININRLADGVYVDVNEGFERIMGYSRAEAVGRSSLQDGLNLWVNPADRDRLIAQLREKDSVVGFEAHFRRKDGTVRTGRMSARRIEVDGQDCILSITRDVTEENQLQARYLRAQRMEAIGQLAGGVAHDFRNQLTVIKGYCELLLRRSLISDDGRPMLLEVLNAADRSTATTGQLLAFSRQEMLRPSVQSLRDCVADLGKILPHMIGEDIRLLISSSQDDCTVNIDPHLFQQALMNLATNARDAMPKGGTLSIETARQTLGDEARQIDPDLPPGNYGVVTVRDTGDGMDQAILAKVFEPFFTTKEVGKGTGLGLPMVYGFVKQSGGTVTIQSQPAQPHGAPALPGWTLVRLYFPLAAGALDPRPDAEHPGAFLLGSETVLLVEDEPAVRAMTSQLLRETGYRVLQANDAEHALLLARLPGPRIDVLVTDIVMPGMNGPALAEHLRSLHPNLPVVFMSGYPGVELSMRGVDKSLPILAKPFSGDLLLHRIRQALDSQPPPPSA